MTAAMMTKSDIIHVRRRGRRGTKIVGSIRGRHLTINKGGRWQRKVVGGGGGREDDDGDKEMAPQSGGRGEKVR